MFRPVKGYITTTRYPLLEGEGSIQIVRNKRKAVEPGTKFWPVREIITTTRRPFRKGHPQSVRNRRAEPSPSSKPYLKEYITSEPYGSKPYLQEEYITTVTYPVYDKFYNTGYFIRPKRAAGGFFQQCLAKLVGVGVGVALVAALIYYFWYRRLKKAKQQQSEEAAEYEERQAFAKRRSSRRPTRGDDLESDYHYQASPDYDARSSLRAGPERQVSVSELSNCRSHRNPLPKPWVKGERSLMQSQSDARHQDAPEKQ
ncbi:uncharacterized protein [Chiloscyllium punctatum]|uniref:uncharacterized protein n=1 Tax=Chiloscyllium punctatum TaxID=137246 RepID=UPI003B640145